MQDNAASNPPTVTYFSNSYPGVAFLPGTRAFALGTLTGLVAADVQAPSSTTPYTGFSNLAPAPPANGTSQFRTMTIGFPTGNFSGGKVVRFTVGRGSEHSSTVGNGAAFNPGPTGGGITRVPTGDLFGGGVRIPDNQVIVDGMTFSGTFTCGGTFQGVMRNRLGAGYSPSTATESSTWKPRSLCLCSKGTSDSTQQRRARRLACRFAVLDGRLKVSAESLRAAEFSSCRALLDAVKREPLIS